MATTNTLKTGDEHDFTLGRVTGVRKTRRMTSLLDASPSNVLEVLRGERTARPLANTSAALPFRLRLETELKELCADRPPSEPLIIRASAIRRTFTDVSNISPLAQLRGILVTQALRLMSAGLVFESPFDESLLAWRSEVGDTPLTRAVDQLDADERARLATDVTAHCVTLRRTLGALSGGWMPRTSLRAHQRLAGGRVILRDVIDLMVGTTTSDVALGGTPGHHDRAARRTRRVGPRLPRTHADAAYLRRATSHIAFFDGVGRTFNHERR